MTTESLCTINSKSNNITGPQQDQQQHHQKQQQLKEQKQTIGGITEAFKISQEGEEEAVTSSASTTTTTSPKVLLSEEKEAQISTKIDNIKRVKTKCYIETLKNQDIDEKNEDGEKEEENRKFKEKSPFIDSRSILTNKENLKKFWEHKMEMDIKLRQQQELSSSCKQPKVVSFDSNNNNSATSNINEAECIKEQQQQQTASEEEWRSLSPNEEPSRFDMDNKQQQNLNGSNQIVFSKKENTKQQQQVSAKLICEKLRDYQANDGEGAIAAKRRASENHERLGITAKNATHLKDKQLIENGLKLNSRENNNEEKKERLDNNKDKLDDRCDTYVPKSANGHNDEIQLMSIDPTLCHSSESINSNNNNNNNSSTDTNNSNINNKNDDNHTSYIKQIESATATNANESILMSESATTNEQTEEQTVNEEFSSSNSSFGPMSMSMPRQEDLCVSNVSSNDLNNVSSPSQDNNNQVETDTEDEPNSTQSGSVLTVITKLDRNNRNNNNSGDQNNLSPSLNDNNQKSLSWNGSSIDLNTCTNSEINDEVEERENEDEDEDEDDEGEESGSNIGVAFESLHFDNDIKSSKQEQVDDELLIAPPAPTPVKQPTVSKFNASEVRSVCNFISAAISDATKQVENYMNLGNSNTTTSSNSNSSNKVIKNVRDINDNYVVNDDVDVNEQQDGEDYEESSQNNNSSSSIQRATFVRESQEFHTTTVNHSNNLSPNEDQELIDIETQQRSKTQITSETTVPIISHLEEDEGEEEIECVDETIPAADLSSIFEANVRREIERFETNSNIKKSSGGKYANKNSLTEWRIAEEIRLFNAREMELKKRFEDSSRSTPGVTTNNNSGGLNQQMTDHSKRQNQQHEAIVRFGKTLQLPKVSNMDPSSSSSTSTSMSNLSKSIKLSTTATSTNNSSGQQQQTTMISMHKFIASGGKRFVFTNTSSSQNNNATTLQNNLLTKSMSNLSTTTTTSGTNKQRDEPLQRVVDYKAVDSLKCKETPNVKPGIARKVIETFSRMQSSQDSLSNHRVNDQASQQNNVITRQYLQQQQQQQQPQQVSSSSSSSCLSNSAEWKIQEELREMRAREAELRDQRSQMLVNSSLQISHSNINQDELSPNGLCNGEDSEHHLNITSNDSDGHEMVMTTSGGDLKKESLGSLSFSSECLYPIKQTIDSFRKLNSSSQQASASTNNNFAQLTSHQNNNNNNNNNNCSALKIQKKIIQTTGRAEQQQNVSPDDYDSKVGGQRRKISMIEKWENKMY